MTNEQQNGDAGGVPVEIEESPGAGERDAAGLIAENAELRAELHMRTAIYNLEARLSKAGARSPGLLSGTARGLIQLDGEGQFKRLVRRLPA